MPKTEEQWAQVRDESRDRIVRAALTLFARLGFARTSIRLIAKEAGISQGLMYNYFAGKDELLREIFTRSMAGVRESVLPPGPGASTADRLEGLIRRSFQIVGRNLEFWRLSYGLRMQPGSLAGAADEIRGWSESLRQEIAGLMEEAGIRDPATEAAVLFALIDGVAQHYTMAPRRYPLADVTDSVVARYRAIVEGAGTAA